MLLFAATFLAYQPAWNGQPLWDDGVYMTPPELRSAIGLVHIWTQLSKTVQYHPLVHSVFWMEWQLWGQATFGYHLVNIFLHVLCALLFVRVLRRLDVPAAWLAGSIFALHPVMVESVAWMTELKNTLSGVLFLSSALAYLKFDEKRESRHHITALALFFLGLLAKHSIVPLPVALLVIFWWKRGRIDWKRDGVPMLPFLAIGIALGLFLTWVEYRFMGAEGRDFDRSLVDRCLIASSAVWFYLYKLLWPDNLIFIYPRWNIDAAAAVQYLPAAALLLTSLLFWRWRGRSRAPLAVLLYFVATLLPALGFLNINFTRNSFVADHFQYLASMGPIAAASVLINEGIGRLKQELREPVRRPLYGALLSVLFVLSWRQSGMYSDAETLYRATIERNDSCWLAHTNLGFLLGNTGRTDEALTHYQKALELNPNLALAHNYLGFLLANKGQTAEAMVHYQKALELSPNEADVHNNLGVLLRNMGRTDEALAQWSTALEVNPAFGEAQHNLGSLLEDMGRTDEALTHYLKALALSGNHTETHYDVGRLLSKMGRTDEAMVHYQKALALDPKHIDAGNNLGILLASMGRTDEAIVHFRRALETSPHEIRILKNLAVALAQSGQMTDAASVLQTALKWAESAGDESQVRAISLLLGQVHEAIGASREDPTRQAQRH